MIRRRSLPRVFLAYLTAASAAAGPGLGLAAEETVPTRPGSPAGETPALVGSAVVPLMAETPVRTPAPPPHSPASPITSGEIERVIEFGSGLAERGDFVGAESALRQALEAPAASAAHRKHALLALARMHRRQGAFTKAAAIYERFLQDYPGDERIPEALLDLGRTLRALGVHKLALARFYNVINSTLKLPGGDFERYQALAKTAQFEIAETYFQSGEFAEASKFYTRLGLLDLVPEDRGRILFKTAHAQRLQGDLGGAVVTLRSFLEQWPTDENVPEARYLLALTLRDLNRPQEAFAATLELLQMKISISASDPKRWAYWQRRTGNQLANDFFEAGNTLNAHAIYSGLLELSPELEWRLPTTYQLGLCYERLGMTERARSSYSSILKAAGGTPDADLAELVRMAAWRLEHLGWRERTAQQLTSLFETNTGKHADTSAAPPTPVSATP